MQVGDVTVDGVSDGSLLGPPTLLFNKTEQDWQQHSQFLDENGLLTLEMGGFLVRSRERLALVDTGIGPDADPTRTGQFMRSLAALEGPLFVGATAADRRPPGGVGLRHADHGRHRREKCARPHSGSTVVVISSGRERTMLLGDAVHCPAELLSDDWEAISDVDKALAVRTREALARELEGSDIPVAAAHFPGLQFGRLLAAEGRRQWVFG